MRYLFHFLVLAFALATIASVSGQAPELTYRKTRLTIHQVPTQVDVDAITEDWSPALLHVAPPPGTPISKPELMRLKAEQRLRRDAAPVDAQKTTSTSTLDTLWVQEDIGFPAIGFTNSVPNDDDIAVSANGFVVQVKNTRIQFYDTLGNVFSNVSLAAFGDTLGELTRTFDPRVVYDPDSARFIIVYLNGSTDSTNSVIVAFSTSEDPRDPWNLYALPGNPLANGTWSDFPSITVNQHDLYIALNTFTNGSTNDIGFTQTVFWAVDKAGGYAGDTTLLTEYYDSLRFNGTDTLFNVCPIDGGSGLYGPNMYLLGNRLKSTNNDTIFVFNVTNSAASGQSALESWVVNMPVAYGLPPSVPQPNTTRNLDTNDGRVQAGFLENGRIQFVLNSVEGSTGRATVYYGAFDTARTAPAPYATLLNGNKSVNQRRDFETAYGNIGWVGPDNRAIVVASYAGASEFPGVCGFVVNDTAANPVGKILSEGEAFIQLLQNDPDRWGDYAGVCPWAGHPGVVWVAGMVGARSGNGNGTGINWSYAGQLRVGNTPAITISAAEPAATPAAEVSVFPNPTADRLSVSFEVPATTVYRIELLDLSGRVIRPLYHDRVKAGQNQFSFSAAYLPAGTYLLRVTEGRETIAQKRIIVR